MKMIDKLKSELDFVELEDRLEMVHLAAADADSDRCIIVNRRAAS